MLRSIETHGNLERNQMQIHRKRPRAVFYRITSPIFVATRDQSSDRVQPGVHLPLENTQEVEKIVEDFNFSNVAISADNTHILLKRIKNS